MLTLNNKRILLGVTGGIATYKSADLVRRLKEYGCDVRVMMTPSAMEFVTPLTFQALSGHPVRTELFDTAAEAGMGHIELARWADAILIAPCSANTLSKLAQGRADNLLTTVCLAGDAPLAVAPAMNRLMWDNPATQQNLAMLRSRNVAVFGPGSGGQACGEIGEGRMLEPLQLAELTAKLFKQDVFTGRHILITAGPTREAIDPVRFISNHSSGKMGFALARAAVEAGANVTLISGPVHLDTPPSIRRIDVETALDMHAAVIQYVSTADIFIGCAAVADYRVAAPSMEKIKKSEQQEQQLTLVKNPDILADVAMLQTSKPFIVGFAAETHNLQSNAQSKLKGKGIHMIAANTVGPQQGFNVDENALHVFWHGGDKMLPLTQKGKLARRLMALIAEQYSLYSNNKTHTRHNEKVIAAKDS